MPYMPYHDRPFPVVRIRGLPFQSTEADVVDFFGGLEVGGGGGGPPRRPLAA